MSKIQFTLGRAHSGKSDIVYRSYAEEMKGFTSKKYVFLVPDQMSFGVQRELLERKNNKTLYNTEVFGFSRMAYSLCDEYSIKIPTVLDDIGKLLLLQKTMQDLEKKGNLRVFRGNAGRPGFIRSLSELLSEMNEYCVTDDAALAAASAMPENKFLMGKITDILTIRRAYEELKGKAYVTADDILSRVVGLIAGSELFKGASVVVDGFSAFNPIQYQILSEIILAADSVNFVLDMDKEGLSQANSENNIFFETRRTYEHILNIADKLGIVCDSPCFVEGSHYPQGSALSHLEKYYEQKAVQFEREPAEIKLYSCHNLSEEIDHVLANIMELIEQGYHYKDIAVITTDQDSYAEIIEEKFGRVKVPYFTDYRKSLFHNIGIESLLAAIAVCDSEFSYESVFRYLKCGLFENSVEADKLDIYVKALGIRGVSSYKKKFADRKRKPRNFDEKDIIALDEYKQKVLAPVISLYDGLKSKALGEKLAAVRVWMEDVKLFEFLEEKKDKLNKAGEVALSWIYGQTDELIDRIITQLEDILGNEETESADLNKLLEMGFETVGVGLIPAFMDTVTIGDIKRSRIYDVKVLFVIGMNDKSFPGVSSDTGILSDVDRELLMGGKVIELGDTRKIQNITMKYFVYRCLVKPTQMLFLSYSKTGEDQKNIYPSYVIGQIKRLFPKLKEKEAEKRIYHARQGLMAISSPKEYGIDKNEVEAIRAYYDENQLYAAEYDRICMAQNVSKKVAEVIDESKALQLFGTPTISVSRLESYAGCQLKFFLDYGLGLNEREVFEIRPVDIGNLYHNALDRIFKNLIAEDIVNGIEDDEIEKLISKSLDEISAGSRFDFSVVGSKQYYLYEQLKQVLSVNLKVILYQLSVGSMKPYASEMKFGPDTDNEYKIEGCKFSIEGKMDRVDVGICDNMSAFRIIDYKSGNTEFDKGRVEAGLQLQLLVYMNAFKELVKKDKNSWLDEKIIAVGAYYYHILDAIEEIESKDVVDSKGVKKTDEEIKKLIWEKTLSSLRMDGITLSDEKVIGIMEASFGRREEGRGIKSSIIKSLNITKDNVFGSGAKAYDKKKLEEIMLFAEDKVRELSSGILSGDVAANPYKIGEMSACSYCAYRGKCGFDESTGSKYRNIKKGGSDNGIFVDRKPEEDNKA